MKKNCILCNKGIKARYPIKFRSVGTLTERTSSFKHLEGYVDGSCVKKLVLQQKGREARCMVCERLLSEDAEGVQGGKTFKFVDKKNHGEVGHICDECLKENESNLNVLDEYDEALMEDSYVTYKEFKLTGKTKATSFDKFYTDTETGVADAEVG